MMIHLHEEASAVAKAMADKTADSLLCAARSATTAGRLGGCGRHCQGDGIPKHVFLRNEPNLFSPWNCIYPSLLQDVTHSKISQNIWVRFPKRTQFQGVDEVKQGAKRKTKNGFGLHPSRLFYVFYVRLVAI
ncbi:MAG TPA: hypothetical protein VNL17_17130 [Verrucomicrobiae bacterium]|nr:hypothetical protein [Verrucomicrobiae bacterium]